MSKFQALLVASDLSTRSDRAVVRALQLADEHGADLTVQHAIDEDLPADLAASLANEAETRLARFCRAQPAAANVKVDVRVTIADPRHAIHDLAREKGADLIVLGLHRDRALMDYVRETTMEHLVRTSARPVLLVSEPADHPYKTILSAIDTGPPATAALRAAMTLAPSAAVNAFYAYHIPFKGLTDPGGTARSLKPYLAEAEAEIDTWMTDNRLPPEARPTVLDAGPMTALQEMRHQVMPDLITLGGHGRTGLARWLLGGFAAELIRDPPCDLLVYQGKPQVWAS